MNATLPPPTRFKPRAITGFPANGPTRVGFAGADVMSGFTAAFGVASALYQRTHTGKGQLVDVAMIDAVTGFLAQQFTEHMMTGRVHEQAQNLSVTRKPTGNLFKTKDGWTLSAQYLPAKPNRLTVILLHQIGGSKEDWYYMARHMARRGMGVLGLEPILIAAVGKDWADYDAWLTRHGVNTSFAQISKNLHTATFMVTHSPSLPPCLLRYLTQEPLSLTCRLKASRNIWTRC